MQRQSNIKSRILNRQLVVACLGILALMFQLATPLALASQPTDKNGLSFQIICTQYGLINLDQSSDQRPDESRNFCPYCQLQEISHSLTPALVQLAERRHTPVQNQLGFKTVQLARFAYLHPTTTRAPPLTFA